MYGFKNTNIHVCFRPMAFKVHEETKYMDPQGSVKHCQMSMIYLFIFNFVTVGEITTCYYH